MSKCVKHHYLDDIAARLRMYKSKPEMCARLIVRRQFYHFLQGRTSLASESQQKEFADLKGYSLEEVQRSRSNHVDEKLQEVSPSSSSSITSSSMSDSDSSDDFNSDVCPICLDTAYPPFTARNCQQVVHDGCGKSFHLPCIEDWFRNASTGRSRNKKASCPNCKDQFTLKDLRYCISKIPMRSEDKVYVIFNGFPAHQGEWKNESELQSELPDKRKYREMLSQALDYDN